MLYNIQYDNSFAKFFESLDNDTREKCANAVSKTIADAVKSPFNEHRIAIPNAMVFVTRTINPYPQLITFNVECSKEQTHDDVAKALRIVRTAFGNFIATFDGLHDDVYEKLKNCMESGDKDLHDELQDTYTRICTMLESITDNADAIDEMRKKREFNYTIFKQ
jgi:hypothetical protein